MIGSKPKIFLAIYGLPYQGDLIEKVGEITELIIIYLSELPEAIQLPEDGMLFVAMPCSSKAYFPGIVTILSDDCLRTDLFLRILSFNLGVEMGI